MQINYEIHKIELTLVLCYLVFLKLRDFTVTFLPLQKFGRALSLFLCLYSDSCKMLKSLSEYYCWLIASQEQKVHVHQPHDSATLQNQH